MCEAYEPERPPRNVYPATTESSSKLIELIKKHRAERGELLQQIIAALATGNNERASYLIVRLGVKESLQALKEGATAIIIASPLPPAESGITAEDYCHGHPVIDGEGRFGSPLGL